MPDSPVDALLALRVHVTGRSVDGLRRWTGAMSTLIDAAQRDDVITHADTLGLTLTPRGRYMARVSAVGSPLSLDYPSHVPGADIATAIANQLDAWDSALRDGNDPYTGTTGRAPTTAAAAIPDRSRMAYARLVAWHAAQVYRDVTTGPYGTSPTARTPTAEVLTTLITDNHPVRPLRLDNDLHADTPVLHQPIGRILTRAHLIDVARGLAAPRQVSLPAGNGHTERTERTTSSTPAHVRHPSA